MRIGPDHRLRGPIVASALLVVALVALLQLVHAAQPSVEPGDADVREQLPPPAGDEELACARGTGEHTTIAVEDVEAQLDPAGRVTSTMVLRCPTAFDGRRVRYVGEVVGDVLERTGGAWVLVNDDPYALETGPLPGHGRHGGSNSGLAVWLPEPLPSELSEPGRPGRRGDVVEISGHILRTDPADGGGLTLRAQTLEVVRPGEGVAQPLDRPQLALGLAATLVAGGLWLARRRADRG